MSAHRRQTRSEQGAVTAELALGLPLVLALTVGLVWLLAVATAQVRVVDAAREAARAVARGEDASTAQAVAARIAPDGASLDIAVGAGQVVVTSSAEVTGPGGLFDVVSSVTVSSRAVAVLEES